MPIWSRGLVWSVLPESHWFGGTAQFSNSAGQRIKALIWRDHKDVLLQTNSTQRTDPDWVQTGSIGLNDQSWWHRGKPVLTQTGAQMLHTVCSEWTPKSARRKRHGKRFQQIRERERRHRIRVRVVARERVRSGAEMSCEKGGRGGAGMEARNGTSSHSC